MNSKFEIAVSSALKVNCQTERNAEIKYDKDTRKINSFFSFVRVSQLVLFLAQRLTVNQDSKMRIE